MKIKSFLLSVLTAMILCSCGSKESIKGIDHTYLNNSGELVNEELINAKKENK